MLVHRSCRRTCAVVALCAAACFYPGATAEAQVQNGVTGGGILPAWLLPTDVASGGLVCGQDKRTTPWSGVVYDARLGTLRVLGGGEAHPLAIADIGVSAGYVYDTARRQVGCLWLPDGTARREPGTTCIYDLGPNGFHFAEAAGDAYRPTAVNGRGEAAVLETTLYAGDVYTEAWWWEWSGGLHPVGWPEFGYSLMPTGISDRGDMAITIAGEMSRRHPWLWLRGTRDDNGTWRRLAPEGKTGRSNRDGVIPGCLGGAFCEAGIVWYADGESWAPPDTSEVVAIADDQTVLVRTTRGRYALLTPPRAGDMDGDGLVTNFDIDGFVAALQWPRDSPWPGATPRRAADMDGDGAVTNFDIDLFVSALGH